MSPLEFSPSDVLDRMRVPGFPRVFVLGCRARRVTVLSQQYRAFNLIWALFATGALREGEQVGIVGGGIGGLTVAGAALLKGCRVILAEAKGELMHLQRGNTTRLLHPNIYEWPANGSEEESTRFPCLNWTADSTKEVVANLESQWNEMVKEYKPQVEVNTTVHRIEAAGVGDRLRLVSHPWRSDPCEVVVVAVGFGLERQVTGLPLRSYWDNESFGQPIKGLDRQKRFLVSGLGDGD
jgi:hypothetical protein